MTAFAICVICTELCKTPVRSHTVRLCNSRFYCDSTDGRADNRLLFIADEEDVIYALNAKDTARALGLQGPGAAKVIFSLASSGHVLSVSLHPAYFSQDVSC